MTQPITAAEHAQDWEICDRCQHYFPPLRLKLCAGDDYLCAPCIENVAADARAANAPDETLRDARAFRDHALRGL